MQAGRRLGYQTAAVWGRLLIRVVKRACGSLAMYLVDLNLWRHELEGSLFKARISSILTLAWWYFLSMNISGTPIRTVIQENVDRMGWA